MANCHAGGHPIEGARVTLTFDGFQSASLNGVTFTCCAKCVRLVIPDRAIVLPERVSDTEAENIVEVRQEEGDWHAYCHECLRTVSIKGERDDAEMGAAIHLNRVHIGAAA